MHNRQWSPTSDYVKQLGYFEEERNLYEGYESDMKGWSEFQMGPAVGETEPG